MMKEKKTSIIDTLKVWFFIIAFLVVIALPFVYFYIQSTQKEYATYELQEMEDGKYVYYQRTVSRVPAQNYEIATISANGTSITIKGDVIIVFTDTDKPYAEVTYTKLVNSDEITVYVSSEQVKYLDTISIH